jgi:hypothetical protein
MSPHLMARHHVIHLDSRLPCARTSPSPNTPFYSWRTTTRPSSPVKSAASPLPGSAWSASTSTTRMARCAMSTQRAIPTTTMGRPCPSSTRPGWGFADIPGRLSRCTDAEPALGAPWWGGRFRLLVAFPGIIMVTPCGRQDVKTFTAVVEKCPNTGLYVGCPWLSQRSHPSRDVGRTAEQSARGNRDAA